MKKLTDDDDMIADGWIKADGKTFPDTGNREKRVEVLFRCEWEKEIPIPHDAYSPAHYWFWRHSGASHDIIWWRYYHEQPETVVPAQTAPVAETYGDLSPGKTNSLEKGVNPKDAIGSAKVPFSVISGPVLTEIALGMAEGARKYGRHNYRVAPVRYSVYYDAGFRHLLAWWEGQDIDPESGVHHLSKAIAGLIVIRDAIINGTAVDDRPPSSLVPGQFIADANDLVAKLVDKYPSPVAPYTR